MHYLAIGVAGLFVFDEKNKMVKHVPLGEKPEDIARKMKEFEAGKSVEEVESLKEEFDDLLTSQPNQGSDYLKGNFRKIVLQTGYVKGDAELNRLLSAVSIELSKIKIASTEKRDKLIVQTVNALSDMEKILNVMSERLREWYGLHYPEFNEKDHEKFAEKVAEFGKRENFEKFKKSMGMELKEEDAAGSGPSCSRTGHSRRSGSGPW